MSFVDRAVVCRGESYGFLVENVFSGFFLRAGEGFSLEQSCNCALTVPLRGKATELLRFSCAPDAVQVYRGYFQKSFGLSVPYPSSEHIKLQFLHEKAG